MKKFAIYILIVLLGVVLLDLAVRAIFTFTYSHVPENAELRQRYKYELNKDSAEVLIIGASRAMFCYKPSILHDSLGMTVYNDGLDGVGVIGQYLSVKNAIKRGGLKIVVCDLADLQLTNKWNQNRISAYYPYYWNDENVREVVDDGNPKAKWMLCSALYQYNSCWHDIVRSFFQKKNHDSGYEELPYTGKEWKPEYWDEKDVAFAPDPWAEKYLDKIVDLCKDNNVKLVITMAPGLGSGFRSSALYLSDYCAKHKVPFWDFTELEELHHDSKLFRDYNHINSEGVKIFTPILAHKLRLLLKDN